MSSRGKLVASGKADRYVECESCGHEYGYVIRRRVWGAGVRKFLNEEEEAETASRETRADLATRLRYEADEVPCPACGHYQKAMVPLYQSRQLQWMWYLGLGLALPAVGLLLLLGPFSYALPERGPAGTLVAILFVAVLLAIPALLVGRLLMVGKLDPNEVEDVEDSKRLGKDRAMSNKRFLRTFYPGRLPGPRPASTAGGPVPLAEGDDDDEEPPRPVNRDRPKRRR